MMIHSAVRLAIEACFEGTVEYEKNKMDQCFGTPFVLCFCVELLRCAQTQI